MSLFWSLIAAKGRVGREDIDMILDALHPGEMGRYVVGKLKGKGPGDGRGEGKPSMLQDLEAGKPLELEALLTAVTRRARKQGVATPTQDTFELLLRSMVEE